MYLMRKNYGFTLIELMVVIAIIAIIAAIAYPSYRDTVLKSRRADAQSGLLACAIAQERWYTLNTSYADQSTVNSNCPTYPDGVMCSCKNTSDGYYSLAISGVNASGTTFTATATPTTKGGQDDDAATCKSFSLTQAGTKSALDGSDNDNTPICWKG